MWNWWVADMGRARLNGQSGGAKIKVTGALAMSTNIMGALTMSTLNYTSSTYFHNMRGGKTYFYAWNHDSGDARVEKLNSNGVILATYLAPTPNIFALEVVKNGTDDDDLYMLAHNSNDAISRVYKLNKSTGVFALIYTPTGTINQGNQRLSGYDTSGNLYLKETVGASVYLRKIASNGVVLASIEVVSIGNFYPRWSNYFGCILAIGVYNSATSILKLTMSSGTPAVLCAAYDASGYPLADSKGNIYAPWTYGCIFYRKTSYTWTTIRNLNAVAQLDNVNNDLVEELGHYVSTGWYGNSPYSNGIFCFNGEINAEYPLIAVDASTSGGTQRIRGMGINNLGVMLHSSYNVPLKKDIIQYFPHYYFNYTGKILVYNPDGTDVSYAADRANFAVPYLLAKSGDKISGIPSMMFANKLTGALKLG